MATRRSSVRSSTGRRKARDANRPRTSRAYDAPLGVARRRLVLEEIAVVVARAGPVLRVHRAFHANRHDPEIDRGLLFLGRSQRLELKIDVVIAGRQLLRERVVIRLAVLPVVRFLQQLAVIELETDGALARIEARTPR